METKGKVSRDWMKSLVGLISFVLICNFVQGQMNWNGMFVGNVVTKRIQWKQVHMGAPAGCSAVRF